MGDSHTVTVPWVAPLPRLEAGPLLLQVEPNPWPH